MISPLRASASIFCHDDFLISVSVSVCFSYEIGLFCSSGCSGACSVDYTSLKLRESPASASRGLWLVDMSHHASSFNFLCHTSSFFLWHVLQVCHGACMKDSTQGLVLSISQVAGPELSPLGLAVGAFTCWALLLFKQRLHWIQSRVPLRQVLYQVSIPHLFILTLFSFFLRGFWPRVFSV